jgi:predicted solute-binding protein
MITYTPEQVLENIKAIAECREEDINLPLAVLRREMPKELKYALNTSYRKTYRQSEKYKEHQKKYQQSEKFKEYQKKYYQNKKAKAKEELKNGNK